MEATAPEIPFGSFRHRPYHDQGHTNGIKGISREAYASRYGNARNVWTIPTQGRSEVHFATYPDELARRCILAGTSEKGVCGECGAPVGAGGGKDIQKLVNVKAAISWKGDKSRMNVH